MTYPPPYHLCELARTTGTYRWLHPMGEANPVPLATSRDAIEFALRRDPKCSFVLGTMRGFVDGWAELSPVAMAVCAPVRPWQRRGRRRVHVYGYIIGGIVKSGTPIPPGHGPEDGCIPFDLSIWPAYIDNLPRAKN